MDLLQVVNQEIAKLPPGPHQDGLKAVSTHIETGFRHLARGEKENDETAFTDVIYRTNQAFEGSVKEAYRVLANLNPHKVTPYDIEKYMEDEELFRPRILEQFSNYRRQWRNPSTHDYMLYFTAEEAFLALVSVSAFSKLLIDQISERLSFVEAEKRMNGVVISADENADDGNILSFVSNTSIKFMNEYTVVNPLERESQLIGAALAFFNSQTPGLDISQDYSLVGRRWGRADLVVSSGGKNVVVEFKMNEGLIEYGVDQLFSYMGGYEADGGILIVYGSYAKEYLVNVIEREGKIVHVIRPAH